jgi:acyl-CoA synthetase (AMP-forming)/AMP-acid ligase II
MSAGRILHVNHQDAPETIAVKTGGSTGQSRQLARPRDTWVQSASVESQVFGLEGPDRFAVLGHPDHSLWAYARFRAQIGSSAFLGVSQFNCKSIQDLNQFQTTVLYGVPELVMTAARLLTRAGQTLASVRLVLLGGGPVPVGFSERELREAFPNGEVWTFYGAAETSFIGFARPFEPYRCFPSVEVQICDEGEIWVRSPLTISPSEWINTGDLGRWADSAGGINESSERLFEVMGRASRQLMVKGVKHPVEPVERALTQALSHTVELERMALVADVRGVTCLVFSPAAVAGAVCEMPSSMGLEQVNVLIQRDFQGFPVVRRLVALCSSDWPITAAGKTNWQVLGQRVSNL